MRLIIQIPCFNEESTLPRTLSDLPASVDGVDEIQVLVIDDGSTDGTIQVAKDLGVDHILALQRNRGLANAFSEGLKRSLVLGADIIVNTDGDHQYRGEDIPRIVAPIVNRHADMVVGDRQVDTIPHFSMAKRRLQKLGSWIVRWSSGTEVVDATSGFRAISRECALRMTIFSSYTYTLETIIQAGKKGLRVISIPVTTNEKLRESRLIRSTGRYVARSAVTIMRIFLMYEPLKVFASLSLVPLGMGLILFARYLFYFWGGEGSGHVQSFVAASILVLLAFQVFLLGLLADLIARNRR
ncbi:MAG: glycosyltransferase family 2 protein, partial [Anaerolineales bacterium]